MAQAIFDIRGLLRLIAYDWPLTAAWASDPERIDSWAEALHRSDLSVNDLRLAYYRRDVSIDYPPSIRELIRLAMPDDDWVEKSYLRAISVSHNDKYHLLTPQEWWAFQRIDRAELRTGSKARLQKRWRELLMAAARIPDLPPPPPCVEPEARLAAPGKKASPEEIERTIQEALRTRDDFVAFLKKQPLFQLILPSIKDKESALKNRFLFQLAREYLGRPMTFPAPDRVQ